MNTGPEDRLSYRELARQRARIQRSIDLQNFSRIQSLVDADSNRHPTVAVDLAFHLDAQGLPWVTGSVRVELDLLCLRCAEVVGYPLEAQVNVCIVNEDGIEPAELTRLAESRDILAVNSATVALSEIVEDELLLALPERLCLREPCERMPVLEYPVPASATSQTDSETPDAGVERENPFAALAELLSDEAGKNRQAEPDADD